MLANSPIITALTSHSTFRFNPASVASETWCITKLNNGMPAGVYLNGSMAVTEPLSTNLFNYAAAASVGAAGASANTDLDFSSFIIGLGAVTAALVDNVK